MKKIIVAIIIFAVWGTGGLASAQTLSPTVFTTSGNHSTGTGVSLSSTIGETFSSTLQNGSTVLTQGEQQPEIDLLTGTVGNISFCNTNLVTIPYTAQGYYGAANIFTAQLSDATGSFASPTSIGTLASQVSGNISATIPLNTPNGSQYRVRVVSSVPAYTGKDNGINITINNAAVTVTSSVINVKCKGSNTGSIDITPSGGTSYTYMWNNGAQTQDVSNLASGTYAVTVTDVSGCTKTATYSITQPATIMSISATKTNVRCGGKSTGSATAVPSGGVGPYQYVWGNGSTSDTRNNLIAGTYTVTVTDASGCTKTKSLTITQNPVQTVSIVPAGPPNQYYANNGGGVGPYTYSWNTSPVQTNQTATIITAGSYKVKVTDSKGCTVLSSSFTVARFGQTISNEVGIAVNPNPTTGLITLNVSNCVNCDVTATMFDVVGKIVYSNERKVESNTTFDFSGLAKGVYNMRVMYDGKSEVVKVIMQ